MTVAQLRAALAERELPEDGRLKAELVARLEAAREDDVGPLRVDRYYSRTSARARALRSPAKAATCGSCADGAPRGDLSTKNDTAAKKWAQLVAHLVHDCEEMKVPCAHGCGAEIRRGDKEEHDAVCPKKWIICPHFGAVIARRARRWLNIMSRKQKSRLFGSSEDPRPRNSNRQHRRRGCGCSVLL